MIHNGIDYIKPKALISLEVAWEEDLVLESGRTW